MITNLPPKFSGSSSSCLLHPEQKLIMVLIAIELWLLGIIFREFRTILKAYAEYGLQVWTYYYTYILDFYICIREKKKFVTLTKY